MKKRKSAIINYDFPAETAIFEIQTYIAAIEKDSLIHEEKNFNERMEVIDFTGFHIIDRIEGPLLKTAHPDQLLSLKCRAKKVKAELEQIDVELFQSLRAKIRIGGYKGEEFKSLVRQYVDFNLDDNEHQAEPGYDNLDIFINGLISFQAMPGQTRALESEMVYYQKTPARIVFELAEKSHFVKEDVFFDLGSGLGQVAILVNLLTGIKVKGIEFEPAFCAYAEDCAAKFNLSNVTFINVDARKADYSEGSIFFMFTPFWGEMLQEVLEILRKESLRRNIKIITYGPCTAQVALQSWLNFAGPKDDNIYKLGVFSSF